MPWGDPNDYWWLKPTPQHDTLPAMEFGARLKQQAIANALNEKQLDLETQRQGIMLQEHFSKLEVQNKMYAGSAKMAKVLAGVTDLTDPSIPSKIYGVLAENPEAEKVGQEFIDQHLKAVNYKRLQEEEHSKAQARIDAASAAVAKIGISEQRLAGQTQYQSERIRLGEIKLELAKPLSEARRAYLEAEAENISERTKNIGATPQTKNLAAADKMDEEADAVGAADPDYADRLRNNADLLRGSTHRAGKGTTTFEPQEKTIGNIKLMQVSPLRWQVVEKPMQVGRMNQADVETVHDLRNQRDAVKLGNPPTLAEKEKPADFQARVARYNKQVEKVSGFQTKIDAILDRYRGTQGVPPPAGPAASPITPPVPSPAAQFRFNPSTGRIEPIQ